MALWSLPYVGWGFGFLCFIAAVIVYFACLTEGWWRDRKVRKRDGE